MIEGLGLFPTNVDRPKIQGHNWEDWLIKWNVDGSSCDKQAERWVQTGSSEADAWMSTSRAKKPKTQPSEPF